MRKLVLICVFATFFCNAAHNIHASWQQDMPGISDQQQTIEFDRSSLPKPLLLDDRQLEGLPDEPLSPGLRELYLRRNKLKAFPSNDFPELMILDLSGNRIKSIDPDMIAQRCPKLKILCLSQNPITQQNVEKIKATLQELTVFAEDIDAQHEENYLRKTVDDSIPVNLQQYAIPLRAPNHRSVPSSQQAARILCSRGHTPVRSKPSCQHTQLPFSCVASPHYAHGAQQACCIYTRWQEAIRGIDPQIADISVQYRGINALPNLRFPWLKSLNLGGNDIAHLPDLDLPQLNRLDLDDNKIKSVAHLNLPKLTHLYLSSNCLDSIPDLNLSSKLRDLHLKQNELKSATDLNLPELSKLDLGSNHIKSVKNLNLPKLENLDLHGNKIKSITNLNLPELRGLDLGKNCLVSIPDLNPSSKLADINLCRNKIESVTNLNLPELKKLDLHDNKIESVTDLNLPKLTELNLNENYLDSIPDLNLPELRELYLQGNKLGAISYNNAENISKLSKLKVLNLSQNLITVFNSIELPELEYLYLSGNKISYFDGNLPKLKFLDLKDSGLTAIPTLKLPELEELDLRENDICYIDHEAVLNNFPKLQCLRLNKNRIVKEEVEQLRKKLKENGIKATVPAYPMYAHKDPNALAVAALAAGMKKSAYKRTRLAHPSEEADESEPASKKLRES